MAMAKSPDAGSEDELSVDGSLPSSSTDFKTEDCRFLKSGHATQILQSINKLRKNNKLCDVTLIVEKKEFPAHRVVLSACSDYFCAMFTSDMAESQKAHVELQGLGADTMEILLEFVYTESVQVSVENVQALLPAACLLQLSGVQKACCIFLEEQLDPSNCLGIKSFAEAHGCEELRQAAQNYIVKHFTELVNSEEFLLLSKEEALELTQCDDLAVPSEEAVFEAVMSWVKHDEKRRKQHLFSMLESVRLPLLTPSYLTDTVDSETLIKQSLDCRDLVDEAKRYHLRPECRHDMQNSRTRPRLGLAEVMYVLGGFGSQQTPVDTVEKYDPKTDQWASIQPMTRKRRYLSSAALDNKLYALGGYDASSRLNTVECLDTSTGLWSPATPMLHRRGLAAATTMEGKLYVTGGFDGSVRHTSMECYDSTIDQWTLVADMLIPREGAGLANVDGVLYCVGGYDGDSILNSAERYDPRTGQWVVIAPMSTRRSGAGVAVLDGQLYAVGGYDGTQHLSSVECYSACANRWRPIADMNSNRCYVGAVVLANKIFAVGGYDGVSLLNSIECYDPATRGWTLAAAMDTSRCDMGVAVVVEH